MLCILPEPPFLWDSYPDLQLQGSTARSQGNPQMLRPPAQLWSLGAHQTGVTLRILLLRCLPYSACLPRSGAGSLAGLSQGSLSAPSVLCAWPLCDGKVDTCSPFPSPCTLGHVSSACPTGLAGQERRKTALMGEALIYSGETNYVKGR